MDLKKYVGVISTKKRINTVKKPIINHQVIEEDKVK